MSHLALFLTAKHGEWKVDSQPTPKPGPGDVLVKILSTALNPVDWKVQKFGVYIQNYPAIVGSDSAGIVEEVGEGVTTFSKGDRVVHQGWFIENPKATFQQYTLVPAEILSKIPDSWSFDQAATLPLGIGTASVGLYDEGSGALTPPWIPEGKHKYKGKPIVIFGGASSVGQYTIQFAALSGFSPIIATSSLKHEGLLKSLGATHVVDRHGDPAAEIKKLLPDGVTAHVYDSIAEEETLKHAVAVSSSDALIAVTLAPPESINFGERKIARIFGNVHKQRKLGVSLYGVLFDLLETGAIKPNPVEVLPGGLAGIVAGLERMSKNQVSGTKLVVRPWE